MQARQAIARAAALAQRQAVVRTFSRGLATRWAHVEMGPKDPILGVSEAFNADTNPKKLNLGVGAYRDDDGKPVVLDCVKTAAKRIVEKNMNNEYLPIAGTPEFVNLSLKLAYGEDSKHVGDKVIAGIQSISGTGAVRLGAEFFSRFAKNKGGAKPAVYQPNPTWGNHIPIFQHAGIEVKQYRYYNPKTIGLDWDNLLQDIKNAPDGSIFLLHASAHNPTGVDPTPDQWVELSKAFKPKNHYIMFDMAYQGFGSGDTEKDAFSLRQFVKDGHQVSVCQSYSKNFGLYGQRVGCFSILTEAAEEARRVESQLKIIARAMYSNPPMHGSRLVSEVLSDAALKQQWYGEVKGMADRIIKMRQLLTDGLIKAGSKKDWAHINSQIGMFCFSGMTPEQVDRLTNEFHIYLTRNGRISMAGVTSKNVQYLAESIHEVTKN